MSDDDLFNDDFFAKEDQKEADQQLESKVVHKPWNVLIVDDEEEIHRVTLMALNKFEFDNRSLNFISAKSAQEGKQAFLDHDNIAMVLLDVVMETEHAGLELAKWIREEHGDPNVRIVLRTGQPGQSPERAVIKDYDINDYKAKTELTAQKLYTATLTALRAYQHIMILERSKIGMEQVVKATKNIMDKMGFVSFTKAALEQIINLINVDDTILVNFSSQTLEIDLTEQRVQTICGTGVFENVPEQSVHLAELPFQHLLNQAMSTNTSVFNEKEILLYCNNDNHSVAFYIATDTALLQLDKHLLNVFAENLAVGLKNIDLNEQMKQSQREVIYRLTEVVENRSNDTGNHVKRVAKYCELLARLYGLSDEECETILFASPLHDIGKVGTPDRILNKPGKLDADEWVIMQSHAYEGQRMLSGSGLMLLDAGATIAGTHHEKWDGSGYPNGLSGEQIPIFGRICALADIFDALCSKRVYKEPWSLEEVFSYIESESGQFFDPTLVELFIQNKNKFLLIKEELKDTTNNDEE
ncbi:HD domain-containing phosphohydrolase [Vibrio amylolyticus]|uniref:HD domain-containing phosphohydrolase n=1 Tax=Vibrio amylolyticus TaxID=2847292 RepID=UPI00354B9F49